MAQDNDQSFFHSDNPLDGLRTLVSLSESDYQVAIHQWFATYQPWVDQIKVKARLQHPQHRSGQMPADIDQAVHHVLWHLCGHWHRHPGVLDQIASLQATVLNNIAHHIRQMPPRAAGDTPTNHMMAVESRLTTALGRLPTRAEVIAARSYR